MQHIIQKQVIELKLRKSRDAFRMQHLISEHYRNEIMHLLENVFDSYCSEEEVLVLDRLEIDFGTISEADLEKARWDNEILTNFKANLLEQLEQILKNKTSLKQARAGNICRQWIFYMQHGYLSWNTLVTDEQWYNAALQMLATDYASVTTLRQIIIQNKKIAHRIAWQHDAAFLTTLVEILTAQNQKLLPTAVEEIYSILKRLDANKYKEAFAAIGIKTLWQQVIGIAATAQKNYTSENIITLMLNAYADELPVQKRKQQHLLTGVSVIKNSLTTLLDKQANQNKNKPLAADELKTATTKKDVDTKQTEAQQLLKPRANTNIENVEYATEQSIGKEANTKDIKKEVEPEKPESLKKAGKSEQEFDQDNKNEIGSADKKEAPEPNSKTINTQKEDIHPPSAKENWIDKLLPKNQEKKEKNILRTTPLSKIIPEEGIFIPHAGIVLTHPFLSSLFRRLQWIEDNYFISTEAQVKAVFMLHYLATGSTTAAEYHLLLCKLMCAYPADESLPAEMIFTEAELFEAADMLTAMIQQWSKLQNTSAAGLREGFLQRSGKLFIKNDMPHVQVESSAIDILLDYLPWSLSIIKLPWMKEILRVEWR